MDKKGVTARSYALRTEDGHWLAQIVITSDGMFAGVTDYGNLSFAWRAYGDDDFRKFLSEISVDYFGTKMATGLAYIAHSRKIDRACNRFAKEILPPLQKVLKEELERESVTALLSLAQPLRVNPELLNP